MSNRPRSPHGSDPADDTMVLQLRSTVSRVCVLGVAAACSVSLLAEDDAPRIAIGGVSLEPMANLRFADGRMDLHPKVALTIGHDDNVYETGSNEIDDTFLHGIAGIDLGWELSDRARLHADAHVQQRVYLDETDGDATGFDVNVVYRREGPEWHVRIVGDASRWDDPEPGNERRTLRHDGSADVQFDRVGQRRRLFVGAGIGVRDYLEDGIDFNEDERDHTSFHLRGGYIHIMGERRQASVNARVNRRVYPGDGPYRDSTGAQATAGYNAPVGERSSWQARAGFELRSYDDGGDTQLAPVLSLKMIWPYSVDDRVELYGRSNLQDATGDDPDLVSDLGVTLHVALPRRIHAGARVGFSDRRPLDGDGNETRSWQVGMQAGYRWRRGAAVGLVVTYRSVDRETIEDFDKLTLGLQAQVVY